MDLEFICVQLVVEVIGVGEITHVMKNNFYLSDPASHRLESIQQFLAPTVGTLPGTCSVLDHAWALRIK